AIRNLVENGVLHAPEGGEVTVTVGAGARVSVEDRGPGVSPQDRAHIFERFWRGKAPMAEGAGLGLAIVKEAMNAHGGEGGGGDNRGGGGVFTLIFPAPQHGR